MNRNFAAIPILLLPFVLGCGGGKTLNSNDIKEGTLEDLLSASATGGDPVAEELGLKSETISAEMPEQEDIYKIGPNDVLNIIVLNHPELSSQQDFNRGIVGTVVKKDGYIYVPIIGKVKAEDHTVEEFIDIYRNHLATYIQSPEVSIDILKYESQKFFVLGQVRSPGAFPVDGDTTLLEAIGMAQGVLPEGNLERAYVIRENALLPINLGDLVMRGDTSRNIYMKNKDMIYVPSAADQTVYVFGEVRKPGTVQIVSGRLSLGHALAECGGLNNIEADESSIKVIRGNWQEPTVYSLTYDGVLLHGDRIMLQPGDRVVVDPTTLTTLSRYMEQILPFLIGADHATRTYFQVTQ